jgi:hypothetical protein
MSLKRWQCLSAAESVIRWVRRKRPASRGSAKRVVRVISPTARRLPVGATWEGTWRSRSTVQRAGGCSAPSTSGFPAVSPSGQKDGHKEAPRHS